MRDKWTRHGAARDGVTYDNTGTEPPVILRYFGPGVNPNAPKIGAAKKNGDQQAVDALMAQVNEFAGKLKDNEEQLGPVLKSMDDFLMAVPNLPHASVPAGSSAEDNVEVRRWGTPREFSFPPKPHEEVAEALHAAIMRYRRSLKGASAIASQ